MGHELQQCTHEALLLLGSEHNLRHAVDQDPLNSFDWLLTHASRLNSVFLPFPFHANLPSCWPDSAAASSFSRGELPAVGDSCSSFGSSLLALWRPSCGFCSSS